MTLPEREYLSWLFRTIVEREDEIKQFHKTLDSVQRELAESRELAAQEQLEKKRVQDKLLELEAQLNATAHAERCIRNEASELHAQARTIPSLRASLDMAQRQLEANEVQCKKYEAMIEKLNFQYEENTQTKARIEELEKKLKEANARLSEYETQHQSDARRLLETMTERDQAQTTLEATNVQLSDASQRVQNLEKQNTSLSQSLVNLEGQARNKTQQVASLEKDLNSLKDRELKLAADCAALQSQLTALHKKSSEMEKRLALTPEGSRPESTRAANESAQKQSATQSSQPSNDQRKEQLIIKLPAQPSPLNANAHGSTSNGQPQAGPSTSQQANAAPAPEPPYHRIPQQRRHILEAFAVITVPDFATGEVTFSRAELTAQLGGGLQGVDGKFGTPRKVAAAHGLTGCIYPQRQTNPWLPALPGQHGYMFLGLEGPAKDNMKFFEPTERALFIQEGPSCWRYYGLYVIQRHAGNDLSQEEWAQFDESFKDGRGSYSDTTLAKQLGKGYDNLVKNTPGEYRQRTAQIREEYDNGTRRVPCITLQCIGYNEQFFNDILACRPSERASLSAKRKRTPKQLPDGTESPSPTRPRLQ